MTDNKQAGMRSYTVTEEMVEAGARGAAEAAGFCWENCAQDQWRRDMRAAFAAALPLAPAQSVPTRGEPHERTYLRGWNEGIERAAEYHDKEAADCRAIALVNLDNDLGADSETHAIDHEIAAEDIRALADGAVGCTAPNRDAVAAWILRDRGMVDSSIESIKEYRGETWLKALDDADAVLALTSTERG